MGSYRTEHVVEFLRRHLEPASPGRDWRIVMADFYGPHTDFYGPHTDEAVFDLSVFVLPIRPHIGGLQRQEFRRVLQ